MVIARIREALEKRRQRKIEEDIDKNKLENYRENEQLQKAEQVKKEADRLAHLKQYKTAIEEYFKALETFPFDKNEVVFRKPAEFFFKIYFNIAASYSFMNKFDEAIDFFDKSLDIGTIDIENKVKALMSKGNCFYKVKQILEMDYDNSTYAIKMESDFDVNDKMLQDFKKRDERENLFKLANGCFTKITELDRNDADAWYKKGHMEFLLDKVKDAMFSFDNVLMINKDYENKESIDLFDDIRAEKGIKTKLSKVLDGEKKFKTKTGHMVKNKAEKMIANFLFENNLIFQYNMAISWADKNDFKAAFFIPKLDLYLEHFKFNNVSNYQKSMNSKIKEYEKNKKKLVHTTSEDEANIEEALKIKLKPYIVL
jgi:tetratricopeptide (TPR) repeat protein